MFQQVGEVTPRVSLLLLIGSIVSINRNIDLDLKHILQLQRF